MNSQDITQTHCCNHYPNQVLRKSDLAAVLDVCEKTVDNLVSAGDLPAPCWLSSIAVWMLYDIHAFISAGAGKPRRGGADAKTTEAPTSGQSKKTRSVAHVAGKYSV